MKKLILALSTVLLFLGTAHGRDYRVELKGIYFAPQNTLLKNIYGGGLMYGIEANKGVWKSLRIWLGVKYFTKRGELTFTKEETRLNLLPFETGIKYSYPLNERVNVYGSLGISYYKYKESNIIGTVNKDGLGYIAGIGSLIKTVNKFFVDIYLDYSSCRMTPADFKVRIEGIETGIGIVYEF